MIVCLRLLLVVAFACAASVASARGTPPAAQDDCVPVAAWRAPGGGVLASREVLELSEGEFLAQSDWRSVWRFDAQLYLPLLHFARMHRIPMVALNVEPPLTREIAQKGLEAVPAERLEGVGRPAPAVAVLSAGEAAKATRALAARLLENGGKTEVAPTQLPDAPLLAIGLAADVDAWLARNRLAPRPAEVAAQGSAQAWAATHRGGRALVVVSARDAEALAALARPLPHYGRQSWIAFDGAKAISRGVWPSVPQSVQLD